MPCVGTLDYVAPEQLTGGRADARVRTCTRSGCLLFNAVTGNRPFERETEAAVLFAHMSEEPPAASASNPDRRAARRRHPRSDGQGPAGAPGLGRRAGPGGGCGRRWRWGSGPGCDETVAAGAAAAPAPRRRARATAAGRFRSGSCCPSWP